MVDIEVRIVTEVDAGHTTGGMFSLACFFVNVGKAEAEKGRPQETLVDGQFVTGFLLHRHPSIVGLGGGMIRDSAGKDESVLGQLGRCVARHHHAPERGPNGSHPSFSNPILAVLIGGAVFVSNSVVQGVFHPSRREVDGLTVSLEVRNLPRLVGVVEAELEVAPSFERFVLVENVDIAASGVVIYVELEDEIFVGGIANVQVEAFVDTSGAGMCMVGKEGLLLLAD